MAYKAVVCNREDWPEDWSEWILVMSPRRKTGFSSRDDSGFRNNDLEIDMPNVCGIYEMALGKHGNQPKAVYIGSTCRSKSGKVLARIQEYCRDGAHKARFINDALDNGYTIYARYRRSCPDNKEQAETEENSFLKLFDYAWNKRNNGRTRTYYP